MPSTTEEQLGKYLREYNSWRFDLKRYWKEMDKWQEMYEFYKPKDERSETDNDISLNTPFAIIESQISKENAAHVTLKVKAKPDDEIGKFDEWIAAVINDAIEDVDVADIWGNFRKTREMWSRQLKVIGNSAAEINYCYKTQIKNGKKTVVADNPYTKVRNWKTVIFNPSMYFDSSNRYYVEDYVDLEDLTGQEQKTEKDGSVSGLYTNLGTLKLKLKDSGDLQEASEDFNVTGDSKVAKKTKPIKLVTRWDGLKMCVIACVSGDSGVIIREATDPLKLGGHNLILGTRYKIEGRPYAYGEIAAIYKPVRAQDTIVNQSIEIVNRYLRGSYILSAGNDIDQFMMVLSNGGAMYGNASGVANVPVNTPPVAAFQTIEVMQSAIERAARFSPLDVGLSNQTTDRTKGTAAGINMIQTAAFPETEERLDDVQDMFMTPVARKYLKMIAEIMGEDEFRYGLLNGENVQWVKASKNIMQGQATLQDFVTTELMTQEDYAGFTQTIDPITGAVVPIPGAEKALVFDVDWIIEAKMDNRSANDQKEKAQQELSYVQWGLSIGVPINKDKAFTKLGKKSGYEDIEELLYSPEEIQQQQQAAQQATMAGGMPPGTASMPPNQPPQVQPIMQPNG